MGKASRDVLNENIKLHSNGILPLFFQVLTNKPWLYSGRQVSMKNIYPYISGIGHEYCHYYKAPQLMHYVNIRVAGTAEKGFRLHVESAHTGTPLDRNIRNTTIESLDLIEASSVCVTTCRRS